MKAPWDTVAVVGLVLALAGGFIALLVITVTNAEERSARYVRATSLCIAFCRDPDAVPIDGGLCACPVRDGGTP